MITKRCNDCLEVKFLHEFSLGRGCYYNRRGRCKSCDHKKYMKRKKNEAAHGVKICAECHKKFSLKMFRSFPGDRHKTKCRRCESKNLNYYILDGNKQCLECDSIKSINEFYRKGNEGGKAYCKMCKNKKQTERLKLFPRKSKKYKRIRLNSSIRSKISSYVKQLNHTGKSKVPEIIGCSFNYFRYYFEGLFEDGMTWDLFYKGKIHLGHLIPCCAFDLSKVEEQKKCFHFSNLIPQWAEENLKKAKDDKYLSIKKAPKEILAYLLSKTERDIWLENRKRNIIFGNELEQIYNMKLENKGQLVYKYYTKPIPFMGDDKIKYSV